MRFWGLQLVCAPVCRLDLQNWQLSIVWSKVSFFGAFTLWVHFVCYLHSVYTLFTLSLHFHSMPFQLIPCLGSGARPTYTVNWPEAMELQKTHQIRNYDCESNSTSNYLRFDEVIDAKSVNTFISLSQNLMCRRWAIHIQSHSFSEGRVPDPMQGISDRSIWRVKSKLGTTL